MNKSEYFKLSNTGNLLNLIFLNSQIYLRGEKNNPLNYDKILLSKEKNYILFPHEKSVSSSCLEQEKKSFQLIIPDGNWSTAAKISNRLIKKGAIPIKIQPTSKSRYQLRKNPNIEKHCTFEATMQCLKPIIKKREFENAFDVFELMINTILMLRGKINKQKYNESTLLK